jgi:thiol-disulfide isomerase/thioredoxin
MKTLLLSLLFFLPYSLLAATPEEIKTTDILGYNINGGPVYRSGDTVTVVTFWASWCPYCKQITPVLESIQRQAGKDNISVIILNSREEGKNSDQRRIFKKNAKYFKRQSLNAQFIRDKKNKLSKTFEKPGLPFTIVIDKKGKITYSMSGFHGSLEKPFIEEINKQLVIAFADNKAKRT